VPVVAPGAILAAFEALPYPAVVIGLEGRVDAANRAAAMMPVLPEAADVRLYPGGPYVALLEASAAAGSEDARRLLVAVRATVTGGPPTTRLTYPRGDAGTQWIRVLVTRLQDALVPGALILHEDITAEHQAAAERLEAAHAHALAEGEAHAAAGRVDVLESITDAFFTLDADWRFTYVNGMAEQHFRRPRHELVGEQMWTAFPDMVGGPLYETYLAAARTVTAQTVEAHDHRAGSWLEARAFPYHGGLAVYFRDTSEAHRAHDAIEASERKYRLLFDANPIPALVHDIDTLRVLAVNAAACTRYGWSEADFLMRTVADLRPPEDLPILQSHIAALRTGLGGGVHRKTVRHMTADGQVFPVDVIAHSLRFAGRRARLVMATDISERQHLEDQLRHMGKLDAMGRLAGGVAHDFNNVLTAIKGFAFFARADWPTGAPGGESLERIDEAVARATALTRQLLHFSRKRAIAPRVLRIDEAFASVVSMIGPLLGEDLDVDVEVPPDLPAVLMDADQFSQVLTNLILNARDALPYGGRLRLVADAVSGPTDLGVVAYDPPGAVIVQVPAIPDGPLVMMSVVDNGRGIAPETMPRLFEPFYTTKLEGSGTGLGLATAYGIVAQASGAMRAASLLGGGTAFSFLLPALHAPARTEPTTTTTAAPPAGMGGTETILVVDDDPAVRAVVQRILERAGYFVLVAEGAVEAVRRMEEYGSTLHLVVADVVLPGANGVALAGALQAKSPGTRVVFMSGYPGRDSPVLGRAREEGRYLEKPIAPETLLAAVRHALEGPP
jgi:two-component system cell cycle sensor histidine kinase/response regulator CckA